MALEKLLNPAENRAGRCTVLSNTENELLKQHIKYAARRRFALDHSQLHPSMERIANG